MAKQATLFFWGAVFGSLTTIMVVRIKKVIEKDDINRLTDNLDRQLHKLDKNLKSALAEKS